MGVVFGIVSGKEGAKVLFLLDKYGEIGTSHSAIRTAAHIADKRRFLNMNFDNGEFRYENGIPSWYAKYQKGVEASVRQLVKTAIPAYLKKVGAAQAAHEKAILAAVSKADKAWAAAEKSAFAPLAKLGAIQQYDLFIGRQHPAP
jgi:hypothetical protein